MNHFFSEKTFLRNHNVYNQGEPAEHIYVVKEGEFEIIRTARYIVPASQDDNTVKKMLGPRGVRFKNMKPTTMKKPQPKAQEVRLA